MAISVLKSGVYAQVTLASLPSLDNNYLPIISGNTGYQTDNLGFDDFLTKAHNTDGSIYYLPHKTFEMVSVKEGQDYLNIPLSLTECRQYNYVCLKNSEMVYYYWIVDYQCLNAEVTRIHLLEDSVQTWFPYVTNMRGQLARSHFRRVIKLEDQLFDDELCLMINPDMYSVDDQASDINYLHCLCNTEVQSGYSDISSESYCLVILNPPLSNWFTFQSHATKWWTTSQDYMSYEVAVNQLDNEYATDSDMLTLITGFSSWASTNLTGYEPLTLVDANTTYSVGGSSGKQLTFIAFSSQNQDNAYTKSPINTSSYGGYDQYVYFAVKYNYLTNFFQSFPQLADYIVDIVQLPKSFIPHSNLLDVDQTGWISGFEVISCTRINGTNSFSVQTSRNGFNTNDQGFYIPHEAFYLITDLSWLRGGIPLLKYSFETANLDIPEMSGGVDPAYTYSGRFTESVKISNTNSEVYESEGIPSFVSAQKIPYPYLGRVGYYTELRGKSIYNELKLDLYPYKYRTYDFYGGITLDTYYNNYPFEPIEAYYTIVYDMLCGVELSLDVSSVPTWSVAYIDDVNTWVGAGGVVLPGSYWQSNDIPAITYAYSYDSWSEYANYSKALTESNLKYKEQSAYISVGSTIASGVINTAVSAATLGLGGAVSTTMSAKNIASSATGIVGNVANTMNALAQQRAKVANNASQLARRTPTDKGSRSNNSSYYLKVNPLKDESNSPSATAGNSAPAYPDVVLTINYADRNQREAVFRNCDLYGYIAPYYVPSMERGSDEWYAIYYSRMHRNYVQWESVTLRFDPDAPKPTYDEVEDLKARLINGVNFVHIPIYWNTSVTGDDMLAIYDELMTGFPEYENLDTLAGTDSGYQEKPYFYASGSTNSLS